MRISKGSADSENENCADEKELFELNRDLKEDNNKYFEPLLI
jgi:hypothetical protein